MTNTDRTGAPVPAGRSPAARWFVPVDPRPAATIRLYAFPHVGAGPAAFGECARRLPDGVELWSVNLPGRQARFREPPRTDLGGLVDELADHLAPRLDGRYALLGYCSGALLAFLIARRLRALGAPPPARLLVVSYPAPDAVGAFPRLDHLPSDEFWAKVHALGGIPEELATAEGYREVFEPALRADFGLLSQYRFDPEPPLDLPLTAVGARHDELLPPDLLEGWVRQTSGEFGLRLLVADHWLLERVPDRLAATIGHELAAPG